MNIADLWKYDLRKGSTDHPKNGACLFDAGMWLVYGKIGDNPPCSCPIIRAYAISLNDNMPQDQRQRLKPFILRVVGNRDPAAEPARIYKIILETARRIVPLTLDLQPDHQAVLRTLPDDASYTTIADAASAAYAASADAAAAYAASAVYAARADYASAAVYAASAVYVARAAAAWTEAINILDEVLRIGKQSPEFDEAEIRASITQFELARSPREVHGAAR